MVVEGADVAACAAEEVDGYVVFEAVVHDLGGELDVAQEHDLVDMDGGYFVVFAVFFYDKALLFFCQGGAVTCEVEGF